jgi:hypothetical protein
MSLRLPTQLALMQCAPGSVGMERPDEPMTEQPGDLPERREP